MNVGGEKCKCEAKQRTFSVERDFSSEGEEEREKISCSPSLFASRLVEDMWEETSRHFAFGLWD